MKKPSNPNSSGNCLRSTTKRRHNVPTALAHLDIFNERLEAAVHPHELVVPSVGQMIRNKVPRNVVFLGFGSHHSLGKEASVSPYAKSIRVSLFKPPLHCLFFFDIDGLCLSFKVSLLTATTSSVKRQGAYEQHGLFLWKIVQWSGRNILILFKSLCD